MPPQAARALVRHVVQAPASMSRLFAAFAGPAPPPVPEPPIDVLKYHLRNMPLAGAVVYLTVILALHRLLRWREQPLGIPRSVLVMYNLVQVAINAYVAYAIAHAVGGWVFGLGVRDTPAVRHGVYLHYLCKYLDMLDTVIIVLRKKREQLSFLHLYHHSSIVVVWGWVVHTWPADASAVYCYGAWINACVHVVMYFYYGLTAVGYRPPPAFKRGVTVFQPPCTYKCTPSSRPW